MTIEQKTLNDWLVGWVIGDIDATSVNAVRKSDKEAWTTALRVVQGYGSTKENKKWYSIMVGMLRDMEDDMFKPCKAWWEHVYQDTWDPRRS